jgi:hypothetical protein
MKVIIAGSRHMIYMPTLIEDAIRKSGFNITEEVCGMAAGADSYGAKWAYQNNIPIKKFPADWETHGKAAGPIRNQEMADYADALIVFIWNGSRGSQDMLSRMEKLEKPCYVVWNGELK